MLRPGRNARDEMRIFKTASRGVASATGLVANLLLIAMLLAIATQVVARFVLGAPTVWAEELARFLLVGIAMIGAAALIERDEHISIDILVSILPERVQMALGWLRDAITLTVCGLLAHYGWMLAGLGARQTTTGLGIKMSTPYMAIPLGAALMALALALSRLARASERARIARARGEEA